jgi:hypothetical protein
VNIGCKAFYIRPNNKIEYALIGAVKHHHGLKAAMMIKNGLSEWVNFNKVYETLGRAIKAKKNLINKHGEDIFDG